MRGTTQRDRYERLTRLGRHHPARHRQLLPDGGIDAHHERTDGADPPIRAVADGWHPPLWKSCTCSSAATSERASGDSRRTSSLRRKREPLRSDALQRYVLDLGAGGSHRPRRKRRTRLRSGAPKVREPGPRGDALRKGKCRPPGHRHGAEQRGPRAAAIHLARQVLDLRRAAEREHVGRARAADLLAAAAAEK